MSELLQGDCLIRLKELPENSVDSIVTDPPYELGFMGKSWDNTGIANNVEMWKECLRVLKPGGYLLSFGGTRTYHRMAVAIEDAGFEVRDMIEWVYGSGFPKSRNIGKDIEKINVGGIKNLKKIGEKRGIKCETGTQGYSYNKEYVAGKCMGGKQISGDVPVYEINNEYAGWGSALKPAHEPICMARKPLAEKTVAKNVLKWGTGGIEIDECRIPTIELIETHSKSKDAAKGNGIYGKFGAVKTNQSVGQSLGRFPANVLCQDDALNDGEMTKGNGKSYNYAGKRYKVVGFIQDNKPQANSNIGDSGSKSRYFDIDIWNEKYGLLQFPKASKSEKNRGCEELETKKYVAGNYSQSPICKTCNLTLNGTNDHSKCSGEIYYKKMESQITHNNHPTVKPLALMRYLVTLVSRKGQIVLDPFAGSGTTLVACKELGRDYIGIELEEEYITIIEARLKATKELEQFKQANLFEKTRKDL